MDHPSARMHDGELLHVDQRVVVAPTNGVFTPLVDQIGPGAAIRSGQVVGHLRRNGDAVAVTSPFDGIAQGMLALDNERVRQYQPVLWLETG